MTADRHMRLKDLLSRAIDLPEAERDSFLREACGDDPVLLAEALDLLTFDRHDADDIPLRDFPRPENMIGKTIAGYRIVDVLGEGGMGTVFLAEQAEPIRRRVALKLVKLGLDTREVIARFESERQTLARMNHPCIANVFDAGATEDGRPYFVMEYIDGDTILKYCERIDLSLEDRLELFVQVCEGIQHAHQKGVIHRDIKPANILVSEVDGRPLPKVIDFGVARAIEQPLGGKTLQTRAGSHIGTLGYISPEQAGLMVIDIDTRTDVYSLGALLNTLLVGDHPFSLTDFGKLGFEGALRVIREEDPPPPSTQLAARGKQRGDVVRIRGELDWITMRALAKDREQRYASPADLAADVRRHLSHEPVAAGPPSASYRVRKFLQRNRAAVIGVAMIALVLVAGTIGATVGLVRAKRAERVAVAEWHRAEAGKLYQMARQDEYPPRALALALKSIELSDQPEYRRLVLRILQNGPTLFRLPHPKGSHNPFAVDFSPDGNWLAVGWALKGTLQLYSRAGGEPIGLVGHDGRIHRVRFSPDSQLLVTAGFDSTICLWSPAEAKLMHTWKIGGKAFPFFLPGEERLVICVASRGKPTRWHSWSLDGGDPMDLGSIGPTVTNHLEVPIPDIDPTGNWVVFPAGKHVELYSLANLDGGPVRRIGSHDAYVPAAFFAPDGDRIASYDADGDVRIWSLSNPESGAIRQMQAHIRPIFARFDQTGSRLAVGGAGGLRVWDLRLPEETLPLELYAANWMFDAAFDPLGDWIVTISTDYLVGVWPLGREYPVTLDTDHEGLAWVGFSPDGRYLVTAGDQGILDAWSLDGRSVGESRRLFSTSDHNFWSPCFDDSSRFLFVTTRNSAMGEGTLVKVPLEGGVARTWQGGSCNIVVDGTGRYIGINHDLSHELPFARILDTETDRFLSLDDPEAGAENVVGFLRDGQLLATGEKGLGLWNPVTGEGRWLGFDPYRAWLCPDREMLLTADREGRLFRGKFDDPEPRQLPLTLDCVNTWVIGMDARANLVSNGLDTGEVEVLDMVKGYHHRVPLFDSLVMPTAVDPLGRWIAASVEGTVRLCPVPVGAPPQDLSQEEFLDMVQALTNQRAGRDDAVEGGYQVWGTSIPDWNEPPGW